MLKKVIIGFIIATVAIGGWMLYVSTQGNRQVFLELEVDRSIDHIEVYDVRDDQTPLATIYPVFDGRRNEVPLRIYREVEYQRSPRSIYYFFIMHTADGASKSDTFTFDSFHDQVKLFIGQSGRWSIKQM